jgi:hypothetical protein
MSISPGGSQASQWPDLLPVPPRFPSPPSRHPLRLSAEKKKKKKKQYERARSAHGSQAQRPAQMRASHAGKFIKDLPSPCRISSSSQCEFCPQPASGFCLRRTYTALEPTLWQSLILAPHLRKVCECREETTPEFSSGPYGPVPLMTRFHASLLWLGQSRDAHHAL